MNDIIKIIKSVEDSGVRKAGRGYMDKILSFITIKGGAYVINLKDKKSKRNTWNVYFDSFGIEYIPQEVLNKLKDKSITRNIFRIQLCADFIVSLS